MSTRSDRTIRDYVSEHYPADTRTARLIAVLMFDLYYGPYGTTPDMDGDGWAYPGFGEACDRIREYADTLPGVLYLDDDGYVSEREPEGWVDDDGDWNDPTPYTEYGRRDIGRIVFGVLAEYL